MKPALVCLLAILLGACASAPSPRALDARAEVRAFVARRLDDKGLVASEARLGLPTGIHAPWTPDRITVAAWYFDPVLAQARTGATRAEADAALAAQRVNPILQLSPEKVFSGLVGTSPWTVGIALLLPLLHPGEGAARRDVAAADTAAARDEAAQAVWQSRSKAIAALRSVLIARDAEALAQQVVEDQNAYLTAVGQRVAVGENDRGTLLAAQLDAQRAQADLDNRRAQRDAAEHVLAAAVGVPWSALNRVTLQWSDLDAPPAPATLPPSALAQDAAWNRLDLAALLAKYRAAEAQLRLAAGTRYPATRIAPGYLYDQGQRKFTFNLDVELPLFHGAGARVRAAAAARDEAAAIVRAKQAAILNDLDATRAGYAQRHAAWRRLALATATAKRQAARATALRADGQADRLAELAARAAASSAALAAEDALSAALIALGQLEDALQRPLWPPSTLSVPSASGVVDSPTSSPARDRR